MLDDLDVGVAAVVTIFTLRRVEAADCDQPVDDAEILEDLLGSRLNTLAARAAERTVEPVDETERDTAARALSRA
jgi:hypothetical protein